MGGHVYIMCNINNTTLYTGVTANLPARVAQHKEKENPKKFHRKIQLCKTCLLQMVRHYKRSNSRRKKNKRRQQKKERDFN